MQLQVEGCLLQKNYSIPDLIWIIKEVRNIFEKWDWEPKFITLLNTKLQQKYCFYVILQPPWPWLSFHIPKAVNSFSFSFSSGEKKTSLSLSHFLCDLFCLEYGFGVCCFCFRSARPKAHLLFSMTYLGIIKALTSACKVSLVWSTEL